MHLRSGWCNWANPSNTWKMIAGTSVKVLSLVAGVLAGLLIDFCIFTLHPCIQLQL